MSYRQAARRPAGSLANVGFGSKQPMTQGQVKVASVVLLIFAVASGAMAVYLSYRSGCAGDLKSGSLGDPLLAMKIGNEADGALVVALLVGSSAFAVWPTVSISRRIKRAVSWSSPVPSCCGPYQFRPQSLVLKCACGPNKEIAPMLVAPGFCGNSAAELAPACPCSQS